jgi:hypothetical protein
MKRLLATISRDWDRWDIPYLAFLGVQYEWAGKQVVLVHGDASRGDRDLAVMARDVFGWETEAHPARWRENGVYNPQAGLLRNREMAELGADRCLAFIKNGSRGATHCASVAEEAGITVVRHRI